MILLLGRLLVVQIAFLLSYEHVKFVGDAPTVMTILRQGSDGSGPLLVID